MKHGERAKKGQGALAIVLILAAILIVAYVAIPSFQAWINSLLNQISGGNFTGFGMTIYYTDGTSKHIDPSPVTITSMSVSYLGKGISKIVFEVWLKVTYNGQVSSNTVSGTMELSEAGDTQFKTGSISYTTILVNGVSTKVASIELTATEMQNVIPIGMCSINAEAPINVQMNFNDGTSDSDSATAWGSITVNCQPDGMITGVTASFNPNPIYT